MQDNKDTKDEELLQQIERNIEGEKDEDESQAKKLVNLVLNSKSKLFFDQFKNGLLAIDGNGKKVLKLKSKEFKKWLSFLGWKELKKAVSPAVIETAVRTLEGHATHDGEEIKLQVRIATLKDKIYYDLGDGRAVEIGKEGWKIIDPSPILFYRFSHQRAQDEPISGGSLEEVYNFIPTPKDSGQKLLLLVWMVAGIVPDFPHPVLVIHGAQGSRKTTLCKLLRRLIDPSIMETLTATGDSKEFVQLASHHYLLPLDNLSIIQSNFSDMLCRVVTGEAMSKRELFSDDDDIIYSFRRLVAMNGINLVVSKPNLLERSLIIELERPEVYQDEAQLLAKFTKAKPHLVGALFDAVKRSLELFEKTVLPKDIENLRMADFVRWGCAISNALGHKDEEFVNALKANLAMQNYQAIEDSLVAQVVIEIMRDQVEYTASPTDLLRELTAEAERLGLNTKNKYFPQTSNWLWRRLEMVVTNLAAIGIKVEKDKSGGRTISLIKTDENAVNAVSAVLANQNKAGDEQDVTADDDAGQESVEGVKF